MTAHGGPRSGAGRKKGSASRSNEEARLKAAASGETPLEYMLRIMRDPDCDEKRRDSMAVAAAPYQHSKLQAVELTGKDGDPIEVISRVERIIVDPADTDT